MSNNFNNPIFTREDCAREFDSHFANNSQGYYKSLEKFNNALKPYVGGSAFSRENYQKILMNDALWKKALEVSSEMFRNDETKQKQFARLMENSREVAINADINGYGLEGWGGGNAVYASSLGAFAMGTTPFIIGGWLAAARSEEIFQHIDNKNNMRLEFEYNIDYLQIGDSKYFFPHAFRSGEIVGYNKLPKVDWVTPNTSATGEYTAPTGAAWCGENMFILLNPVDGATSAYVKGNLLEVSGRNKHKYGIEPNFTISAIQFKTLDAEGKVAKDTDGNDIIKTRPLHLHYDISTGRPNERIIKSVFALDGIPGVAGALPVQVVLQVNMDDGEFTLFSHAGETAAENALIVGFQFDGKVSNIANELTNLPTMGVDKYQFIRECEYRNYSKVSLNEYMADNFRIGATNQVQYAAYATDKNLQYTLYNRELEAEEYLLKEILADGVDINTFELTRKMGGFVNNNLSFTINAFTPGMHLQDYKEGLKLYLTKTLAMAETDINIPASVNKQWVFLGYDAVVTEIPEIKFENAAVELNGKEGGAANENYGYAVDTKCGFVDSIGRSARFIANNDSRWRDRGSNLFGTLRTFTMEYPFLVYYPHAIRMFTAIDADNPNRTAIVIGGREFRGNFAAAALQYHIDGVMEDGQIVNNFAAQVANSKTGYEVTQVGE
jgi:hypothetical protein